MDTTQNGTGPGMGNTVMGSSPKKGKGLVSVIVIIIIIVVAILFLTSESPENDMMDDQGDEAMIEGSSNLDDTATQEAEATADLSAGDDLADIEADLNTVETEDLR